MIGHLLVAGVITLPLALLFTSVCRKYDNVIGDGINAKLGTTIPFTRASESEGKLISLNVIRTVTNGYPWMGRLHVAGLRKVIDPCRCCIVADKVAFLASLLSDF